MPYEFVRLRYFFGQRLGVLELTDAQAYVVAKQRFHNRHLHGAGVLCGLRAERYTPANQASSTMIRVTSGAAIDGCGREIVVGWDVCIDVAAWVKKHGSENPVLSDPDPGARSDPPPIWVVVCYQECPSDPAPAPKDPCGCEPTGCEYSRVREGFRLDLVWESDLPESKVVELSPERCPSPPNNPCLVLARIDLVLDANGEVADLAAVVNDITQREQLWSTAAIQAAFHSLIDASDLGLALAAGPRVGQISFTSTNNTDGTLVLPFQLAEDGTGTLAAILGDPTTQITLTVRRLLDDGTWQAALTPVISWNAVEAQLELTFSGDLEEGRYRLSGVIDVDTPVLDTAYRELLPRSFARWFQLTLISGVLTSSEISN